MLTRKINAWVSLLTTAFLLIHAIGNALRMIAGNESNAAAGVFAWALAGLMLLHAFISIDLAISAHTGIEKRKCKSYPKMNVSTLFQRASGVLMIPFAALHIVGAVGLMQPPKIVHAILPLLFFTLSLAHAAVSASKALITLGIGSARFIKTADIVIKVFCGATLLLCVIGFNLYY